MVEWSGLTHALDEVIAAFLTELAQANRSAHTCRAYATDLQQFAVWHRARGAPALPAVTPALLRDYFATLVHLCPATRARKQAALASFLTWAYRQG